MIPDTFTCGRRTGMFSTARSVKDTDTWKNRDGYDACSYCGSIRPDKLLEAIEAETVEIGATDKNYKIYVSGSDFRNAKFYFQHFYDGDTLQIIEGYADRFVKAWKGNKIKFQGGIEFYRIPFFIKTKG